MTNRELATAFSGGKFSEVADFISETVEWNIYEEQIHLSGKTATLDFCTGVAKYFASVTTKFEMTGLLDDKDKVAIYGRAEFIREGKTINVVHSCDIYEFDPGGMIQKVFSYCNSKSAES